jgi:bifunctional non-homologous end joining protein LigD
MELTLGKHHVVITHENKILFPKSKITKKMLAEYYLLIAPLMLPLIKDRPISMKRFPKGIGEEGFFQKNVSEGVPKWVKTVQVTRKEKENIHMVICNDKATLLWLVNQNCITPHIWLSRYDQPQIPDRMIFDLDPPTHGNFSMVIQGAHLLREILEDKLQLKTFINTTGSRGLHVVVPIKRENTSDEVRHFAHNIASYLVQQDPKLFTIESRKNNRGKKLYIDVLRNGYGQTAVAPYSVREHEGAPIALPISWSDLKKRHLTSDYFTIKNIKQYLSSAKNPWKDLNKSSQSLQKLLNKEL